MKINFIGVISGIFKNMRTGKAITDLGDAMDQSATERCCGIDCCNGVWITPNHGTVNTSYVYIKNGMVVIGTKASFEADKAASFV